ncbi:SUMF1/EgtB/PvdO family nonheme iron enzyme [Magnetospira sp. QH-2]|uniref:formylglycine-generating enzyme family protein n=1 Tax=Magnetospira sp. (strain QH-2) TaxID=1288970 RepID=UPI0005FA485E|nr:SUMF1/EgtB/PvdO family nonheme iron enzyme [Magnetospira sp. QH-2]
MEPGEVFRDCETCPEMVVVPAGSFIMGAEKGKHMKPPHKVTFAKPFALGRTEVTFNDYALCVEKGGCAEIPHDHKWGRDTRPVINVTYAEIKTYVAWLAEFTGKPYRLPSEAEWEYAARAGTSTRYWWGDKVGEGNANCRDCGTEWSGFESAPVATFEPNPFGFYDMNGNVWEWVADCWNKDHKKAPADGSARMTGQCNQPVTRGGSWYYFPKLAASAYRYRNGVEVKSYNIGFRVARDME